MGKYGGQVAEIQLCESDLRPEVSLEILRQAFREPLVRLPHGRTLRRQFTREKPAEPIAVEDRDAQLLGLRQLRAGALLGALAAEAPDRAGNDDRLAREGPRLRGDARLRKLGDDAGVGEVLEHAFA